MTSNHSKCGVVLGTFLFMLLTSAPRSLAATGAFEPPASPRAAIDFNAGWRFIREDASGADAPAFDDSRWEQVTTPHTFNDVDS
ncbi:MAG TPA: hypothetical protein VLI90_15845, partial [Tepidisphaeraceae bacterium]|nr:hypothetical protein [Tepidisphaeraceae bacterium]